MTEKEPEESLYITDIEIIWATQKGHTYKEWWNLERQRRIQRTINCKNLQNASAERILKELNKEEDDEAKIREEYRKQKRIKE